jgi:hypothetical protein
MLGSSMRLTHTSLIAAVGFGAVWIAAMASCNDEDPNKLKLTTAATMMQMTGGMGGTASDGGAGAGANGGGTGGNPTGAGGDGGQGGQGEQPVHGCLSTTAEDRTGDTPPHIIAYPGTGPICIKINDGDSVDFNHAGDGSTPQYRVIYGTIENSVKQGFLPDGCLDDPMTNCPNWVACENMANGGPCAVRTHYCPAQPYACTDPAPTGPLNKVAAEEQVNGLGVFPFYDDILGTVQGVIYVE